MAIAIVDTTPTATNNNTDAVSYTISPFSGITGLAAAQIAVLHVACATPTTGTVALSGWTQVNETQKSGAHVDSVWWRKVAAGDTTATTFTFDPPGTATGITYGCIVYSGVDVEVPFLVDSGSALSTADGDDIIATPSVHNSDVNSWWVACFSATNSTDSSITCAIDSGTERVDLDGTESTGERAIGMYDSNGTIAIADYTRTGTFAISTGSADLSGWIGILQAPRVAYRAGGTLPATTGVGTGTTTVTPNLPAGWAAHDLLTMVVGTKDTAPTINTPTGWFLASNGLASGGGGVTGLDTGPTQLAVFCRVAVAGDTDPTVSITSGNSTWAIIYAWSTTADGWDVAAANGTFTGATSPWTVTCNVDPGIDFNDNVLVAHCIPTDIDAGSKWSGEGLSATGVTFTNGVELCEPSTSQGNDLGGLNMRARVSGGPSSGVPTVTATVGGTLTNVRGTSVILRIRAVDPIAAPANQATAAATAYNATVATTLGVSAAQAAAVATANNTTETLTLGVSAAQAAAVATANNTTETLTLGVDAAQAAAVATAYDTTETLTLGVSAAQAAAVAVAYDTTVETVSGVDASADTAEATVVSYDTTETLTLAVDADTSFAVAVAYDTTETLTLGVDVDQVAAAAVAYDVTVGIECVEAFTAPHVYAYDATVQVTVDSDTAESVAVAYDADVAIVAGVAPEADIAVSVVTAYDVTGELSPAVDVSEIVATAYDTTETLELGADAVTSEVVTSAYDATVDLALDVEVDTAAVAVEAYETTVSTSDTVIVNVDTADVAIVAYDTTVDLTLSVEADTAAVSAEAYDASVSTVMSGEAFADTAMVVAEANNVELQPKVWAYDATCIFQIWPGVGNTVAVAYNASINSIPVSDDDTGAVTDETASIDGLQSNDDVTAVDDIVGEIIIMVESDDSYVAVEEVVSIAFEVEDAPDAIPYFGSDFIVAADEGEVGQSEATVATDAIVDIGVDDEDAEHYDFLTDSDSFTVVSETVNISDINVYSDDVAQMVEGDPVIDGVVDDDIGSETEWEAFEFSDSDTVEVVSEEGALAATRDSADTGHVTEAASSRATFPDADTAHGIDFGLSPDVILIYGFDTGHTTDGAQTIGSVAADTVHGTDAVLSHPVSDGDTGHAVEGKLLDRGTPFTRTLRIAPEDRVLVAGPEDRTFRIPAEVRALSIQPAPRNLTIPLYSKVLIPQKSDRTLRIEVEDRVLKIPKSRRTLVIENEWRIKIVRPSNRELKVDEESRVMVSAGGWEGHG